MSLQRRNDTSTYYNDSFSSYFLYGMKLEKKKK